MTRLRFLALCGSLLITGQAQADAWRSVENQGFIRFTARLEGAEAPGTFRRFDVGLDFGGPESGDEQLRVEIDITSADMFSSDLNEGIADPAWFDFENHRNARFESNQVLSRGSGTFLARGELTLKGVTHAVEVPFQWVESAGIAVMEGNLVLLRGDFNIGSGEWANEDSIGQNVELQFEVKLAREQ